MKLKSAGVIAAAAILGATNANAGLLFDPYIGATVGIGGATTFIDDNHNTDMSQSYGAVLGLDIPLLRIEGEYNYIHAKDLTAQLAMGNVYLKMPTPLVSPYIGAGVGAIFDGEIADGPKFDTTTAYQAMLGLTFKIPVLPFNIDAEARALYAHDLFSVAGEDGDLLHYDIRAKLRYVF